MKYTITSTPMHCGGDEFGLSGDPKIGDVIEVTKMVPDSDGDVYFEGINGRDHIALSCLTPVREVGEATISVKVTPDLNDFAAALVAQIADSFEEAARALRASVS